MRTLVVLSKINALVGYQKLYYNIISTIEIAPPKILLSSTISQSEGYCIIILYFEFSYVKKSFWTAYTGRFSSVKGSISIARITIIVKVNSTANRDWKCVDFENKSSKKDMPAI